MRSRHFVGACIPVVGILIVPLVAVAQTQFTATLNGANERPTPNNSQATGQGTGELTGGPGAWVFTYNLTYTALEGGTAELAHIHDSINPDGAIPTEQFGPVIHDLDSIFSPVSGDWRFDDVGQPLTDEFAAKLLAGELYFNVHNDVFPLGEIRGQIVQVTPSPVIPLPAPVAMAGAGLIAVIAAHLRRRGTRL